MPTAISRTRRALTATSVVAITALVLFSNLAFRNPTPRAAAHPHATMAGVYIDPVPSSTLWASTLDPSQVSLLDDSEVIQKVYAGLVKQVYSDKTKRFTVAPDLASGWKISGGGTVYTFTIRPGAKFSDGTPVTAQDFVTAVQRTLNPKNNSPVNYYLFSIKGAADYAAGKGSFASVGVKAVNSTTVQFTLEKPYVYFLYALSYPTSFPVEGNPAANAMTTNPSLFVGAGPWMLKGHTWKYRQEIVLVPNPYYYDAKNFKIHEIDIYFPGTVQTNFNGYLSGQYPMTQLPVAEVAHYRGTSEFHETVLLYDTWLAMNVHYKPFTDLHFRRAIAYAIDRNALAQGVLHGTVKPLYGWYPQGILGYDPNILKNSGVPYFNPTIAKQELALAKKDLGTIPPITLEVNTENADRVAGANFVASNLRQNLGIQVSLHLVPGTQWSKDGNSGKTPFIFTTWIDDYPDPQDFSDYIIETGAGENWGRYSNPTVDRLFEQGAVTANTADRAAIYKQAQLIILRDAAVAMLDQVAEEDLISTKYHGIEMNPSWASFPQPVGNNWANVTVSG